jgi:hypothetical protein
MSLAKTLSPGFSVQVAPLALTTVTVPDEALTVPTETGPAGAGAFAILFASWDQVGLPMRRTI